jgi:hypothetical protein
LSGRNLGRDMLVIWFIGVIPKTCPIPSLSKRDNLDPWRPSNNRKSATLVLEA